MCCCFKFLRNRKNTFEYKNLKSETLESLIPELRAMRSLILAHSSKMPKLKVLESKIIEWEDGSITFQPDQVSHMILQKHGADDKQSYTFKVVVQDHTFLSYAIARISIDSAEMIKKQMENISFRKIDMSPTDVMWYNKKYDDKVSVIMRNKSGYSVFFDQMIYEPKK